MEAELLFSDLQADDLTYELFTDYESELRRVCSFKDIMMTLPQLDAMVIAFPSCDWTEEDSYFHIDAFPTVSTLSLDRWQFSSDSPKAIQRHINYTMLSHLTLVHW